jgi:hypothetical protein
VAASSYRRLPFERQEKEMSRLKHSRAIHCSSEDDTLALKAIACTFE